MSAETQGHSMTDCACGHTGPSDHRIHDAECNCTRRQGEDAPHSAHRFIFCNLCVGTPAGMPVLLPPQR